MAPEKAKRPIVKKILEPPNEGGGTERGLRWRSFFFFFFFFLFLFHVPKKHPLDGATAASFSGQEEDRVAS